MRLGIAITIAAVAMTACSGVESAGPDVPVGLVSQSDAALFCRAWPDAREKLLKTISGEAQIHYQEDEITQTRFLADVGSTVPNEIRTEWDQAYAMYRTTIDLLFITGYSEGTIRPVHLTMAFGDTGIEGALAATEAALATIEEWAITGCGDFSSRWPELSLVLERSDQGTLWDQGSLSELARNIDKFEAALAAGEKLVPDEIETHWRIVAGYQKGFFALARSIEFDAENMPDEEEGEALFIQFMGVDSGEAREARDHAIGEIWSWVHANSDPTAGTQGTSGGPGSLMIRILPHQYITNRRLLLALLPPGTDFSNVKSVGDYVAGSCTEVIESPEEWEQWQAEAARQARDQGMDPMEFLLDQVGEHFSRPLQPIAPFPGTEAEYAMQQVCSQMSHEAEAALVPGGSYELFVGTYLGGPGSYGIYFASPQACIQFPVVVNGDTVVDLPELEPCNLEPLGRPDEIARRTPPPVVADGTLRVQFDSALLPVEFDFCRLDGVLLPAGTSLNNVGRGEVWPAGMFSFAGRNPNHIETEGQRRSSTSPGLVPMLAVSPSGSGIAEIRPSNDFDGPWDIGLPEPVPLAAGSYDLRFEETCENEDARTDDDIRRRCAFIAVEVKGATTVEMPELGTCP